MSSSEPGWDVTLRPHLTPYFAYGAAFVIAAAHITVGFLLKIGSTGVVFQTADQVAMGLLGIVLAVTVLYRVSLPKPLPTHRLLLGAVLATVVFVVATVGLRFYLTWITETGYTYGALATPIAFLLFAFALGFAIMLGAELNAAIEEEWPAPDTHARRLREWLEEKAETLTSDQPAEQADPPAGVP